MSQQECEHCNAWKSDPITLCVDCDREYILIDVRFYRALREGTFRLEAPIQDLEGA